MDAQCISLIFLPPHLLVVHPHFYWTKSESDLHLWWLPFQISEAINRKVQTPLNMVRLFPLAVAIASGIISHLLIFIRGEWHLWTSQIVQVHSLIALSIFAIAYQMQGMNKLVDAAISTLVLCTAYTVTLCTSITIYRIFFHRLKTFRGPFLASVTKFWHVWQCRTSQNHLVLDQLRETYGNIVRTGRQAGTPN